MPEYRTITSLLPAVLVACVLAAPSIATSPPPLPLPANDAPARELFVPMEDLNVLLEGPTRRVLLSRDEYLDLVTRAEREPASHAPRKAVITTASYHGAIQEERAEIAGTLVVDVLEPGLHAVGLTLGEVGLRRAMLDDGPAPIGRTSDGRLKLFVEGVGRHELRLEMVTPVVTDSARQVLNVRLPSPAATSFSLSVPGDVEAESAGGAAVSARVFAPDANETRFELVPEQDRTITLVMTLNSRMKRTDRLVVARSVMIAEVMETQERIHATISLSILHRAVESFRFRIPEGFEPTSVTAAQLASWTVRPEAPDVLEVRLREPASGTVVISATALRDEPRLGAWTMPRIEPLETAGHTALLGVIADARLKMRAFEARGLAQVDIGILDAALPPTLRQPSAPIASTPRPLVALYAPQANGDGFAMTAAFDRIPKELLVQTNTLLTLKRTGHEVHGGFTLSPRQESIFSFSFSAPEGWHVEKVTDARDVALEFRQIEPTGDAATSTILVPGLGLAGGIEPGTSRAFFFNARRTPPAWLDAWSSAAADVPVFAVQNAARDRGAVAIVATDDLVATPDLVEGLIPLDEQDLGRFGLSGVGAGLAYSFDQPAYRASMTVTRVAPRLAARTYSFFNVLPDMLTARYELEYEVSQASTRELSLLLPVSTPEALSIRGVDGLEVKGYAFEIVELPPVASGEEGAKAEPRAMRRWTASLTEPRLGTNRLIVEFQLPMDHVAAGGTSALPIVLADDVVYQSGVVSVEGSPQLNVEISGNARPIDVGELVDAQYKPGARLLGVWEFIGDEPRLERRVTRDPLYGLPPAIVERARLFTSIAADGTSVTQATFDLRTKALFLDIRLPDAARLWTITLDGEPTKPQHVSNRLLLDLPARAGDDARTLAIVYEASSPALGLVETVDMRAPELALAGRGGVGPVPIPVADLEWTLGAPDGFRILDVGGTVETNDLPPEPLAVTRVGAWLVEMLGGTDAGVLAKARAQSRIWAEDESMRERPAPATAAGPPAEPMPGDIPVTDGAFRGDADTRHKAPARTAPPPPASGALFGSPVQKPDQQLGKARKLLGARSLAIQIDAPDDGIVLRNLGAAPEVSVTLAEHRRLGFLAWTAALLVLFTGLLRGRSTPGRKASFVIGLGAIATIVAIIVGRGPAVHVANMVFYAAAALIPIYILIGAIRWVAKRTHALSVPSPVAPTTTSFLLAMTLAAGLVSAPAAAHDEDDGPPVVVPEDVIIAPYDGTEVGAIEVDQLLVPYDRFVELWNLAYPDAPIGETTPPVRYALSAGNFTSTLPAQAAAPYFELTGHIDINVYVDDDVMIPLPVESAVITSADLDGAPARLSVVAAALPQPRGQQKSGRIAPSAPLTMLHVSGRGHHRLELALRAPLERRGGWRIVEMRTPAAAATAFTLRVPSTATEVRLNGVTDRQSYETTEPNQMIRTALPMNGVIQVRWRPRVGRGATDLALRAASTAVLDVQEDGLALRVRMNLEFPRSQREEFTIRIPSGYLVEKVSGLNVRGWTVNDDADDQLLTVTTLKPAQEREDFVVHLRQPVRQDGDTSIRVVVPKVTGASLQNGRILIRRSPGLAVRTTTATGVTRIDADAAIAEPLGAAASDSPLGTRPYEAYRFVNTDFELTLAVEPVRSLTTARHQTIIRIAQRERQLETRVLFDVRDRPLHRLRLELPDDLEIEQVSAPGMVQWSDETAASGRRTLTAFLRQGQTGTTSLFVLGTLGTRGPIESMTLPRLGMPDADRQSGWIAVQADPAFSITAEDLTRCENVLMSSLFSWLVPDQRPLTRLALRCRGAEYGGTLRIAPVTTEVTCRTFSNVRVTEMAFEDTALLEFTIQRGGAREFSFLLPGFMRDARIEVPLLRRRTVAPATDRPGWVRVHLELQDEVMDRLLVLIENDRPLRTKGAEVPIPIVETGETERRFAAVENAGRDEIVVTDAIALQKLGRQQAEWRTVADLLSAGPNEIYVARGGGPEVALRFDLSRRTAVQTAGARIGLARTMLVLDSSGAYRARQIYRIDNTTEQHLEIELPEGAQLWSTAVAGAPVKPVDGAKRRIRIPLVKTAAGDLDYEVVVKYGGAMRPPSALRKFSFPLLRSVNVNVELSQVRLLLPESKSWLNFSGSMRRVTDEGEFEAGYLSYQTKKLEQLTQTASKGNVFAQLRSADNIRNLGAEIESYNTMLGQRRVAEKLGREIASQQAVLDRAEKQVDVILGQEPILVEAGNRERLSTLYFQQDNQRSTNVVQDVGWNFDPNAIEQIGQVETWFSNEWVMSNDLVAPEGKIALIQAERDPVAGVTIDLSSESQVPAFANREVMDHFKSTTGKDVEARGKTRSSRSTRDRAGRYQQALEDADEGRKRQRVAGAKEAEESAAGMDDMATRMTTGRVGGGRGGGGGAVPAPRANIPAGEFEAGWASLDFELPERGVEYRFTTPRGDVEIAARPIARAWVTALVRLLGLGVVLVVILIGRRIVGGLNPATMLGLPMLVLALVLGVALVVVGFLPVLGLMLIAGVIVAAIYGQITRRAAPAS